MQARVTGYERGCKTNGFSSSNSALVSGFGGG